MSTTEQMRKWRNNNREHVREYARRWAKEHPEAHNRHGRKQRYKEYGLTKEKYDLMFEQQKGLCAICSQPETAKHQNGKVKLLSIDHNHKTKNVRGLLCNKCNLILGQFEAKIKEILSYLRKYDDTSF